jgi:membrane protein insertase Oxa1/YidC/SpoIIIJ
MNNTFALGHFFSGKYWFSLRPESYSQTVFTVLLVVFLVMIITSFVLLRLSRDKKRDKYQIKILEKIGSWSGTIGFLAILFTILKQYHVYLFSARFWALIIFVVAVIWLYKIVQYVRVRVPEIKQEKEDREELKKYLPKSK